MMKIAETIIEQGITEIGKFKRRTTVRGVYLNEKGEVLMLYSSHFNDYTFPGGGVKADEDKIEALKRELSEEIGARDINVKRSIGHISEIRYGISGTNSLYRQTSHYYLCEINGFGATNHIGREREQGLEAKWVTIAEAIAHNTMIHETDRQYKKGLKTVLLRENAVLAYIKEHINEEIWNSYRV